MDTRKLRIDLGRLASREYQERLIVGGTTSEYDTPEEIFDDAIFTIEYTLKFLQSEAKLQYEMIKIFDKCLRKLMNIEVSFNDESITARDLVERNPEWNAARESARECLDELNFRVDLKELLGDDRNLQ